MKVKELLTTVQGNNWKMIQSLPPEKAFEAEEIGMGTVDAVKAYIFDQKEKEKKIIEALCRLGDLFPTQCPVELACIAGEIQTEVDKIKAMLKEE